MGKVNIYLSDSLQKEIEDKSRRNDLKKSQIVQRALKKYLDQDDSTEDETDIETVTEKQEELEEELTEVRQTQNALLKKLGYKIKLKEEPEFFFQILMYGFLFFSPLFSYLLYFFQRVHGLLPGYFVIFDFFLQ